MMNFNHLRKMAKGMGVNTYRMKKTDIIRAIQKAEHNIDCYGTERVTECREASCLWRGDCVALGEAAHRN
jgi:Rho termination factor, N-terminal domain